MTYLLDTDTCVYWLRGREPVRARLAATAPGDDLTLVNHNRAHFERVAGLRVESWVA